MRHILWALALLATFTLTAFAQREGAQSAAGGGGSSGGGSSGSSSSGSSGGSSGWSGGYSGGSSSDSGGGSWSGSSSGGSSSRDYSGGGSSSSSGASTSRGSSGSSSGGSHSSSGSSGGSSAGSSRSDSSSRGSSVAPVLDGGPPPRPPRPNDKHPDKKAQAPASPAPVAESGNTTVKSAPTWPQREGGPSRRDICDLLPPWDPFWESACARGQVATSQVQGPAAYRSCDWLLRQVEQEEFALAQLDKQRGAACGQDPAGADCQGLTAQYQQLMQRVRQGQAAYNRCQAGHP